MKHKPTAAPSSSMLVNFSKTVPTRTHPDELRARLQTAQAGGLSLAARALRNELQFRADKQEKVQ